ncbi:hypothetical protein PALB_23450 [Pseudoalteromonas luteoviolacea B = ATCC 29581]|nr:hypothetical protein PALB_23450 [Pseudoalteromonas luteoviolacea B = ATCC 29581]
MSEQKQVYNFSYGSNMATARLFARLPNARLIGAAHLDNWKLTFRMHSTDGSAKCDIEKAQGERVFGMVYALTEAEKRILDDIEGERYDCVDIRVSFQDGRSFNAFAYVANTHDDSLKPYPWYLNHVIQGAIEANVPEFYLSMIKATLVQEDLDDARAAREWSLYKTINRA